MDNWRGRSSSNMMQQQFSEKKLFNMNNFLEIMAERDAAIRERNRALLEKKAALEKRQAAIAERNLAIKQRDDAVLERDNAILILHQSMIASAGLGIQRGIKSFPCIPVNNTQRGFSTSDNLILDALCKSIVESDCSNKIPQPKRTFTVVESRNGTRRGKARHAVADQLKLKNDWDNRNLSLNRIHFDGSIMPVPHCSCTGIFRHCYKWGNGGWQSSCCTTTVSAFPLPPLPNKRHGRLGGRKMSGGAFSKLLTRLALEGFDLSLPVDLKDHWSKHGTNRYITIK